MAVCLELAERGRRRAAPNPMVGAVVVAAGGEIVGRGFHERCGGPHAEAVALAEAGARARGATLHVSLEPCRHEGRTPPCSAAILAAGIAHVVYGVDDPDPRMAGASARELAAAGVVVEKSPREAECARQNRAFFTRVREQRPLVLAKWAMSLDGRIATATGESRWITGEAARAHLHGLRDEVDAILVGAGTVAADDPELTCRGVPGGRNPRRVVLDGRLNLPLDCRLVTTAREVPTLVLTSATADPGKVAALTERGVEVLRAGPEPRLGLRQALGLLAERDITTLMVEGGADTLGAFLAAGLIDRVAVYVGAKLIGGQGALGPFGGEGARKLSEALALEHLQVTQLGNDLCITGET